MKSLVFTFGNMNNVCIFATLNIFKSTVQVELAYLCEHFLCLYLKYRGITIPPCGTIMEPQHSRYVLSSGKGGNTSFFIVYA